MDRGFDVDWDEKNLNLWHISPVIQEKRVSELTGEELCAAAEKLENRGIGAIRRTMTGTASVVDEVESLFSRGTIIDEPLMLRRYLIVLREMRIRRSPQFSEWLTANPA